MIDIVINGALGRMAREVAAAVRETDDIRVSGAVDSPACAGEEIFPGGPVAAGDISDLLDAAGCVVDFSAPEAAASCLEACAASGVPFISGTTGMTGQQLARASELSSRIPVMISPNMSAGVNLMFRLAEEVARALPDFAVEISEIHHDRKKDAPSGTAARLAESIMKVRDGARQVYGRSGMTGARSPEEIGMHSLRGGDVTGEHTVVFAGRGERLELTHRAHSRRTFAMGTLRAIRFIAGRDPGMYSMADVLDLR